MIQWLKDRRHAQTTGEAIKLILDGRVKSDSHPLGFTEVEVKDRNEPVKWLTPMIPATLRDSIEVVK